MQQLQGKKNSCKVEYGSCNFFETYTPIVNQLRVPTLRSDYQNFQQDQESDPESDDISLSKDLVVAVAAADNSLDTVWFVKIIEEMRTDKNAVKDKYGNTIQAGQPFLSGHFLESTRHPNYYTESKKTTYFYKESVVYPCVQVEHTKKGHLITSEEYLNIINYVEVNNLRMI